MTITVDPQRQIEQMFSQFMEHAQTFGDSVKRVAEPEVREALTGTMNDMLFLAENISRLEETLGCNEKLQQQVKDGDSTCFDECSKQLQTVHSLWESIMRETEAACDRRVEHANADFMQQLLQPGTTVTTQQDEAQQERLRDIMVQKRSMEEAEAARAARAAEDARMTELSDSELADAEADATFLNTLFDSPSTVSSGGVVEDSDADMQEGGYDSGDDQSARGSGSPSDYLNPKLFSSEEDDY